VEKQIKLSIVLKWLIVIISAVFAWGTVYGKLDNTSLTVEKHENRISALEQVVPSIQTDIEWIKKTVEDISANTANLKYIDFIK
jgi:peptidoglycan hydrolase CwlO-like protein